MVAARAFYVDVLGCAPGQLGDFGMDVWFFGMQLTLQLRPDEVLAEDEQGVRHFGVTLDPATLDELLCRLEASPVQWIERTSRGTVGSVRRKFGAKVADPSGYVIEFKSYDDPEAALGIPRA
jgi:extradiol dioxygenase family protein